MTRIKIHRALQIGLCLSPLVLGSCALQEGPLGPLTDTLGAQNPAASGLPHATLAVGDNLEVTFDKAMDPATLTSANVKVYIMDEAANTAESLFSGVALTYDIGLKRLTITPGNGWTTNRSYRLLITTGATSVTGSPLDGNENYIAEPAAYDNYTRSFSIGSPIVFYNTNPLQISNATVKTEGGETSFLASGIAADLPVTYSGVTITVTFNDDVAVSTIFNNATTLHANVGFVNFATGAAVSPVLVSMTASDTITGVFMLQGATTYKLTVRGGLTGVRSSLESSEPLLRGRYFDGPDADGVAEASDEAVAFLRTQTESSTTSAPPVVSFGYSSRMFTGTFTVPQANGIKASTINSTTVKLVARYGDQTYLIVPEKIEFDDSDPLANKVNVYVPDSFYPFISGMIMPAISIDAPYVKLKLSSAIQSTDGIYLDGNSNGIGGEAGDDALSDGRFISSLGSDN